MSQTPDAKELQKFLDEWPTAQAGLKISLAAYREGVLELPGVVESFVARPGVSYSLRWDLDRRPAGRQRPLFALVDVVPLGGDDTTATSASCSMSATRPPPRWALAIRTH